MRDIYSATQALTIMLGTILLHRQWTYMSTTLSSLAASGAIVERAFPLSNRLSKVLLIDRITNGVPQGQKLDTFVTAIMTRLTSIGGILALSVGQLVAAAILALSLVLGQKQSLFAVLVPKGLPKADREAWLQTAYHSWWAGEYHRVGYFLYFVLAIYAMFLILSFQITGIIAAYMIIGVYFLTETSADWLNHDRRWGWRSVAQTYRTVVLGNLLLAATLTDVLIFIGTGNFAFIIGLLLLYVVVAPFFIVTPMTAFKRVAERARESRVADIRAAIVNAGIDVHRDFDRLAAFTPEIDRCNNAVIKPLQMGKWSMSTFIALGLIPIGVGVAQIFFSVKFGSK